jgi:hypothetical protein
MAYDSTKENLNNWDLFFAKRFWEKVIVPDDPINECWIWDSSTDQKGYGTFRNSNRKSTYKRSLALRLAYEYFHAGELDSSQFVCHTCDNPKCVNPHHLYLGDHITNMKDKLDRGRTVKGMKNGRALLTENEVLIIREKHENGYSKQQLAKEFLLGWTTVDNIIKRNTWKHI